MDGWSGGPEWKVVSNMLVNDGSAGGVTTWNYRPSPIVAPYKPASPDYTVEAEIQLIREPTGYFSEWGFGIAVRLDEQGVAGYYTGFYGQPGWGAGNSTAIIGTENQGIMSNEYRHNTDWHVYRIEVKGNSIRFLLDGVPLLATIDNRYLSAGQIGLYSSHCILDVRSFKVIAP